MSIEDRIVAFNSGKLQKGSYSIDEVAAMLSVTRQTVYKLIKENVFEVHKINNSYRIDKISFDRWLDDE